MENERFPHGRSEKAALAILVNGKQHRRGGQQAAPVENLQLFLVVVKLINFKQRTADFDWTTAADPHTKMGGWGEHTYSLHNYVITVTKSCAKRMKNLIIKWKSKNRTNEAVHSDVVRRRKTRRLLVMTCRTDGHNADV